MFELQESPRMKYARRFPIFPWKRSRKEAMTSLFLALIVWLILPKSDAMSHIIVIFVALAVGYVLVPIIEFGYHWCNAPRSLLQEENQNLRQTLENNKAAAYDAESKSQARIAELVKRPELEILFDVAGDDYVYEYPGGFNDMAGVAMRLYKVAVRGKGDVTIENVKLELVEMKPHPPNFPLPLPLNALHDIANPSVPRALNPGTVQFFNVIQMPENGQGWMQIYTTAQAPSQFQRGRYELRLRASGRDALPAEQLFITEVNAEGKLVFYSAD